MMDDDDINVFVGEDIEGDCCVYVRIRRPSRGPEFSYLGEDELTDLLPAIREAVKAYLAE